MFNRLSRSQVNYKENNTLECVIKRSHIAANNRNIIFGTLFVFSH